MLHIFLDTNIVFNDPFFKGTETSKLLLLCRYKKACIYLSDVNIYEIKKHCVSSFTESYDKINKEIEILKKNMPSDNATWTERKTMYSDIDDCYLALEKKGYLKIVSSDGIKVSDIMERYLSTKKPFTDNRSSFQDSAIWLSYVDYIKKNGLADYYLVANNPKDFSVDSDKNKEKLHEDLINDLPDMKYDLGLKSFFIRQEIKPLLDKVENEEDYKNEIVNWLDKSLKIKIDLDSPNLINLVLTKINSSTYLKNLFEKQLESELESQLDSTCSEHTPEDFGDYNGSDYAEFDYFNGITNISADDFVLNEDNSISIFGNIELSTSVTIYAYNYSFERSDPNDEQEIPINSGDADISYSFSVKISFDGVVISSEFDFESINSHIDDDLSK